MTLTYGSIRIEVLPDDSLPGKGPGRYSPSGNFHLSELRINAHASDGQTAGTQPIEFSGGAADQTENGAPINHAFDGNSNTHWSIHPAYGLPHEAVFDLKQPLGFDGGTTLVIRMEFNGATQHQIGRFRLSYCTGEMPKQLRHPLAATLADLLKVPAESRTTDQSTEIGLALLKIEVERQISDLPIPNVVYAVSNSFESQGSFKPAPTPRPIHLLERGNVLKPGVSVDSGTLRCLPHSDGKLNIEDQSNESLRREALAQWISVNDNPLTWRSIVNRVWHYHFGSGLVDSPNDFGRMGSTPSHPELLDWLALWFRDEANGSLKKLHRLILTSRTYQQTVGYSDEAANSDPQNRLLWRMNRQRLTGEQLRDSLLQLSGQINLSMGGSPAVQFVEHGNKTFMPDRRCTSAARLHQLRSRCPGESSSSDLPISVQDGS